MDTNFVQPLFAMPFGVVGLGEAEALNSELAGFFKAHAATDAVPQNPLRYQSPVDLLLWPDPRVRSLATQMFRGVHSVVSSVNQFSEERWNSMSVEGLGWFTIVRPNGRVPATSYPLTSWCAVYCVAAPEPSTERHDSGALRLFEPRPTTMFQDASNSLLVPQYASGHSSWQPVPGQMAVFPASLTHEVGLIRAAGDLILVTLRVRYRAPGQTGMTQW
jgi:hypothetical protein